MKVLHAEVVVQALRMLELLDRDYPGARDALAADAWSELEAWDGLQLRLVPDSQTDERCSVAGGYVHTTVPPTLSVTDSLSPGRRSFTALHELGHHLQKNNIVLARAVRSQPADTDAFEDAACDAFAARVLITDDMLESRPHRPQPVRRDAGPAVRGDPSEPGRVLRSRRRAPRSQRCRRRIRRHWPRHVRPRARRRDRARPRNRSIAVSLDQSRPGQLYGRAA